MKKYVFLALSLVCLTACATANQISTDRSQTTVTTKAKPDYQAVITAYEQALGTSDFVAADFPLVNPVSRNMLVTFTNAGPDDLFSKQLDLDGNGTEELLLGSKQDGDLTLYTALYGQVNGQMVDLLADALPADADNFLVIYQNNRLRVDRALPGGLLENSIYQLTDQGLEELLTISTDDGEVYTDQNGNTYQSGDERLAKIEEVLSHGVSEQEVQ